MALLIPSSPLYLSGLSIPDRNEYRTKGGFIRLHNIAANQKMAGEAENPVPVQPTRLASKAGS